MPIKELLKNTDFFLEPMALVAADGTITASNLPFAEQLGLSVEALADRRLDALAVTSAAAIQEYLRACTESRRVVQASLVLRRRTETSAVVARGVAYRSPQGPSACQVLLHLLEGASARSTSGGSADHGRHSHWNEVEESLRRQSRILEVTLASIGDAVVVTDREGRINFLNSVAEELTGWTLPDAKARKLAEVFHIVHERTRQPVDDPVATVLATGHVAGLANHTLLISRDGREIPIDDSAAPIRSPDDELFGVVLIFRDITQQRRAEHARAWLASIVESSEDAIVSKTLDGIVTSWNPGATRLFGYAPEEIVGKPILTIVPPDLHDEETQILARLRNGEHIGHFETQRLGKDGRRIDISLTVSPVRDEQAEIVGASKIARDITERKRAEQALRDADRRKDEFMATLAHELRNPLTPMRNAVELLRRGGREAPQLQSACGILDRQLRQMTRLVEDLLDLSRIGSGHVELQPEVLELGQLLRNIAASWQASFDAAGQRLETSIAAEPLHVYGDRVRLTQAFSNLFLNAQKYTQKGGRISITVREDQGLAVVSIQDTGIGIPPSKLAQVFELFAQVDPGSGPSRQGLGIGLNVARRLVEMHGGRIEAHSDGEGCGSEFVVRLPLRSS